MYTVYIKQIEITHNKIFVWNFYTDGCLAHFTFTKKPIAESCAILDVIEDSEAGRNMIFRKCHFERASARKLRL